MSNPTFNDTEMTETVFADPVDYLAGFGIEAQLVVETTLPAAA